LGEIYEAFAAEYGWTREYIQAHLTRPQIRLYWFYLNRRKFKELERQAIVLWGYDPRKKKRQQKRKELAEKWQEDPLYGFPYDIEYLSKEQIMAKIAVSRRFWNKIAPEKRWDKERGEACLGRYGIVAKRCSMNDKLWGIYQKAKQRGVSLSLEEVRKMILLDIKRSKLYPPGWQDDTVDPPEWYLEELREKGLLEKILKEIDEVAKA
jgi:hypothetical protein